jgi:hypothetical protein
LLHVGVSCKTLASRMLVKGPRQIGKTGPHTAKPICELLQHYGWEVKNRTFTVLISRPEILISTNFIYSGLQVSMPRCDRCLSISGDCLEVLRVPSATHVSLMH